jgi:formylglycine-generating enzyme required for sulfatase activity
LIALHSSPRFLAVINQINDSCSYVGAWDTDTTRETLVVPEEPNHPSNGWINQTRVTELVSQGWRPSAIALGNRGLDSDSNLAYGSIVFSRPLIPAEQIESHAKKQANTLIALYELGEREKVWRLLDNCITDARVRSYFQAYLTQYGADPEAIVQEFLSTAHDAGVGGKVSNVTTSTKLSTAILAISLGDFQQAKMLDQRQHALVRSHALKLFVEDVDSGVHSSCEWLLKQLGAHEELRAANQVLSTGDVLGNRNWYRTKTSDDTFVLLGPTEYVMGSPIFEKERYGGVNNTDEAKHRRKINYRFAIGSKETTIEQFQRFRAKHSFNRDFSKESDAPANRITWFDAVAYCNFLSSCEGIKSDQFCYEINPTDPRDIVVPPDILSRTGYRLPTEAEWEYACRAGSTTARPYGETKELLGRFAWFADNSGTDRAIPVGTLRPNDFGLFDMLGNIFEWNQEGPYGYTYDSPYSVVGRLQSGKINPEQPRILRGGSFVYLGSYIRSSRRFKDGPAVDNNGCGFRISRSYR